MNAMIPTIVIVLILYFAAMVVIGWMGRSKASNFEGYLSMGRSAGVLLLMGGAIGGRSATVSWSEALQRALSADLQAPPGIACALSTVVVALFLNNFIYNNGYVYDRLYRKRYHNEIPGTIYDLSTAISPSA